MVLLNRVAAAALAVAPAVAAPTWKFPSFPDFDFTLPGFSLPTGLPTGLPTDLPTAPGFTLPGGYGHGASPSKTASSVAPSGTGSKPASTGVSTGLSPSGSSSVVISPVTGSQGSSPVGSGTRIVGSGTSPVGTGTSVIATGTSKVGTGTSVVGTGTSKVGTGTSVVGSGTSKVGTGTSVVRSGTGVSSRRPSSTAASTGSSSTSVPTAGIGAPVNTTSGLVLGHLAENTTSVSEYLGIRFGQPPVGELRFAAPVAYTSTDTINGSDFGFDCPCTHENVPTAVGPRLYSLLGDLATLNDTLGEDCLFLNVWSRPQSGPAVKPVLVWLYGGGFSFGGSNSQVYTGKYFVEDEDVVFVSLNYRTNIFGFSGSPGIAQNTGLLDQRLALEWVRDNIAAFGGDPSRITLFGQSAGGASVDLYTFAYPDDPIIAGAVPMSGSADSFGSRSLASSQLGWNNVTVTVGCGNSSTDDPAQVLKCMQSDNITWQNITVAAAPAPGLGSLLGNFGPTVDNISVFPSYPARAAAGQLAKVPTLTGNLNYESGLLILIAAGAGQTYPQSTWDYIDDQIFTCPVSRIARQRQANNIPIWRYWYGAGYPNLLIPTANISQAWHTSELPVLFGDSAIVSQTDDIPPETELGNYIRNAWVTFATDPTNGLNTLGWPQYTTGNLIALGQDNATVATYSNASAVETPCTF